MGDRAQLEEMEARWILDAYLQIKDKQKASQYITAQTARLSKFYGNDFDSRCRRYMRQIFDGRTNGD